MKKANLIFKDIASSVPAKKERKKGGLLWLWSKIKAPFVGATGGDGVAGGLSSASRASGILEEMGSSAAEEVGGVGQQFDNLALRVASRVGVEASPWVGKAIMAAVAAGVIATGVLAARHFGASASFKSPYAPIASGINAHPSGPNSIVNAPAGSIGFGAGENTTAAPTSSAGKNAIAQNPGKTVAANVPKPGVKTNMPGGLGNLAQPALAGGAPVGGAGAMPQYGGQAAQEAAMAKNAFQQGVLANVMPMSIGGAPMMNGNMGSLKGKGLGSKTLGALRGATAYNANMQGTNYDQAAQNAINQFDNNGIASGGGLSEGGATTGSPNAGPSVNPNSTPGMMGGSGSNASAGSQPLCQDISQLCSPAQIAAGGEVVGSYPNCSCSTSITIPGGQQATPWQKTLNTANILMMIAAGITVLLGAWILYGKILLGDPFTTGIGLGILSWAGMLTTLAASLTVAAIVLATHISSMGGHQQAMEIYIESAAIGVGLVLDWTGSPGWGIMASLLPFIGGISSLIGF